MVTATAPTTHTTSRTGHGYQHQPLSPVRMPDDGLAQFLGWFSVGLGLTEIFCHRGLARMIGVNDHPVLFPLLGLRELAAGVGILTERRPAGWLWSRVAGDAMDLALLGAALGSSDTDKERVAVATAAVAGVTALDVLCSKQHSQSAGQ